MILFPGKRTDPKPQVHDNGLLLVAISIGGLASFILLFWVAGELTYLFSFNGFRSGNPFWLGATAVANGTDPLRHWPPSNGGGNPPAVLFWVVFAVLTAIVLWIVLKVGNRIRSKSPREGSNGFATQEEETATMSAQALVAQAPELRPSLVMAWRTYSYDAISHQVADVSTGPILLPGASIEPWSQSSTKPAAIDPLSMIQPTQVGIYIGESVHTGQQIWKASGNSLGCAGLSGSGKTSRVVIPSLLGHDGPAIMSTTRPDVLAVTWASRRERGPIHLFDPLSLAGSVMPSLRWTPIAGCEDPAEAERATAIFMDNASHENDPNQDFRAGGASVIQALLHAAALGDKTVSELLAWSFNSLVQEPEYIIRRSSRGYQLFADQLAQIRTSPEKQRLGSYLSVQAALKSITSPRILPLIDIRPSQAFQPKEWLQGQPSTLYMLTHKDLLEGAAKMVALLVSDLLNSAKLGASTRATLRLDPQLKFLADEVTNTCLLPDWPSLMSDSRGWGLDCEFYVQSRGQLRNAFGKDQGDAIWESSTWKLNIGGGSGGNDGKDLADLFGEHDQLSRSYDLGGGAGSLQTRRQSARTVAEVRNLKPGRAFLIADQTPPVELAIQPWWTRADAAHLNKAKNYYDYTRQMKGTLL